MFGHAWCAEIVGHAPDRDHQRVVAHRARRRDLALLIVECGGEAHLLSGAIESDHLAEAIAEGVPMRLGEVVDLVFAGIDAACGHRMQERLPEMGPSTLDQGDRSPRAATKAIAEAGCKLQTRRAAA